MCIFLTLLILAFTLLILVLKYQHGYWRRRHVPHNTPNFPMGDFTGWNKTKSVFQIITPIYQKFKGTAPFAGFYMGFKPVALILDIELVKNIIIKDFNSFHDRGMFCNEKDDPISANLVTLTGTKWSDLRHKLTHTFTSAKMKYMYPTISKVAEEFIKVLKEEQAIAPNGVMEMIDPLSRFTTDVIGNCAFGIECNSLRNPQSEFVSMGRKAIDEPRYIKPLSLLIDFAPKLARKLRMSRLTQEVHDFYMGLVSNTLEYREKNQVQRNDFMQILLELKKDGQITVNEVTAHAFVFLVAGSETTTIAIGFALYELARNEGIQDKLRAEINQVIKQHNNELTYDAMADMKYLHQVFSETLRKYPVFPRLTREATVDYITNDPRYVIEKGTMLNVPVYAIHHDPQFYPNPEQFDPNRFSDEEIKKRPSCTYLPFGDGPRNCIGLRFSKLHAYIGLIYLLRNFKFNICDEIEKEMVYAHGKIVVQSANGIKLRVLPL